MTIFIASLFLPYTVNFRVDRSPEKSPHLGPKKPRSLRGSPPRSNATNTATASLFHKGEDGPDTKALTPGATTEHETIFVADAKAKSHNGTQDHHHHQHHPNYHIYPFSNTNGHQSTLSQSEAHSPMWGATKTLNQPRPRTYHPLPSPSILKHQEPLAKFDAEKRATGIEAIKEEERQQQRAAHTPRGSISFSDADWGIEYAEQGNNGLRNAIRSASRTTLTDDTVWVGTLGMPTDALNDHLKAEIAERLEDEFQSLPVFVNDGDFDGHYTHFSKTILWPVFHYQIPDNPKSKAYEDHSWIYYVKLNEAFAQRIAKNWKRRDTIWIHDYHLLLVPAMLRKLLPDAQIGFFLHVAFPSSEVFRCLAPRKELLEGVLGADLIGFQTDEYCRHFLQTCSRILCVEARNNGVQLEDRFVNVDKFPIGIDPKSWDYRRQSPDVDHWINVISERYQGKRLIVSRDKLDSIRGVRQKLLSYELFLNTYPEFRDKVVLIQVGSSTNEQVELETTISDIAMRINSTHSTLAHQPLVFLKQDLNFAQYLALITVADALMVTSLREGMNLTSHEFVYCQDGKYGPKAHGSLILSEFTGSASIFDGHALLVNPWDYRQCAEAIHTALTMSESEREATWRKLYDAVLQNSTTNWVKSFRDALSRVWSEHSSRETVAVPRLSVPRLEEAYKKSNRRLLFLDYEGTLASWGSPTSIILTTPQRALTTLADLLEDPKNLVYVMSSRRPEEMERLFRQVSGLGLIAENGCFVREPSKDSWIKLNQGKLTQEWKAGTKGILNYFRERTEGSWIEELHCSLVFHYGAAEDKVAAARQASECADHINDACANQRVHVIPVEGALVIQSFDTNKANAAELVWRYCLEHGKRNGFDGPPDFLFVVGDDREDEAVFHWANKLQDAKAVDEAVTVTLGSRSTEARATLTQGVTGVLSCLQRLAAQDRTMPPPHTQAYEDALTITPESSHTYSANLSEAWTIGAVPHGGYTMAVLYRLAIAHFKHTHPTRHNADPMPIAMQMSFLRRSAAGPALLTVEDAKLGARTSTIHVTLAQVDPNKKSRTARVVGYITVSDTASDVGPSSISDWTLYPPPPSAHPPDVRPTADGSSFELVPDSSGSSSAWKVVGSPFSDFRRAANHSLVFAPVTDKQRVGLVDQWARLRTIGPGGGPGRWTNETAVVLLDLFPMALGEIDRQAAGSGQTKTPPFWFPTVTLNIDFKKRLPAEGVDWLYCRVNMKAVRNGRTDIEVVMKDEAGDIVALASQVGLVVSAARNTSGREYGNVKI
ncbi:alpha,alpha-trehalose-phosphate synthase (UDP-forming) [Talaromyces islandicus]|uniref:Alpha,alpha-trehalose-phosphate synthase (UDP-forming) n=1 Tax=Talaromyces islandicus TaxID=28573 RepID=A0A0U1M488_TALIS|nr:alpha,alpha-trehalose-phosphate synthase (UDP-forming) [Talaromyces islandicus]